MQTGKDSKILVLLIWCKYESPYLYMFTTFRTFDGKRCTSFIKHLLDNVYSKYADMEGCEGPGTCDTE